MKKIVKGPVRDKEKTKQKLLHAVGLLLRKEGHKALKVNRISEAARVDKKLIYNYFGGLNGLIDTYLHAHDFWKAQETAIQNATPITDLTQGMVLGILKGQFDFFEKSEEMQNIVLWELCEKHQGLMHILAERERFGEELFKISDKHFKGSAVNFRAVSAILVAAIYYLILHSKHNNSTTCGIDITTPKGKSEILNTIEQILTWCYADKQMKKGKTITRTSDQ